MRVDSSKRPGDGTAENGIPEHNPIISQGGQRKGKLIILGTGPGSEEYMAPAARKAILESGVIIGYKTYIKLIRHLCIGKRVIETGMKKETDRAAKAVEEALAGNDVCVVSSGDPGVYGMASLVLQMVPVESDIKVQIIPGITAATAAAALLGAPLTHDFAVISLSDLLTDSALIEKRLSLAARGDFVTVLYNPKSRLRTNLIKKAHEIFLSERDPATPVGIVKKAFRGGEEVVLSTLAGMLKDTEIDMFTTIIIGNSQTTVIGNYMVTPRGYRL